MRHKIRNMARARKMTAANSLPCERDGDTPIRGTFFTRPCSCVVFGLKVLSASFPSRMHPVLRLERLTQIVVTAEHYG